MPTSSQQQIPNGGVGSMGHGFASSNGVNHYTKVEFPKFDGVKVEEWLYKAKNVFD